MSTELQKPGTPPPPNPSASKLPVSLHLMHGQVIGLAAERRLQLQCNEVLCPP